MIVNTQQVIQALDQEPAFIAGEIEFRLDEIPPQPTRETFKFLLDPKGPDAAMDAVKAIYAYLFWEDKENNNQEKLNAALTDKDSLIRWVKDRADKGLNVFDDLIEMSKRANLLYQITYARSGMQFHPDENEDVYEHFSDLVRNKIDSTKSSGEKYELTWAVETLIPTMKDMGLDPLPLIGRENFYTKFRHWTQAIRQRDRIIEASNRRWQQAKDEVARKLLAANDPDEQETLKTDLLQIVEQEADKNAASYAEYEVVIRDGFMDIVNPDITVKQIDDKWRFGAIPISEVERGVGYTALINGNQTLLIAEFDYLSLTPISNAIESLVDVKGMTDPLLIIKQLRDFANDIEATLGGR